MNTIYIAQGNPIRMVKATNTTDQYWADLYPQFERKRYFCQKWQTSDKIVMQIYFNTSIINLTNVVFQIRQQGTAAVVKTFFADYVWVASGMMNITFSTDLAGLSDGHYYLYLYIPYANGTTDLFYSEPQYIASEIQYSTYLQYTNKINDFDMYFLTDIYGTDQINFYMRAEGGFKSSGFQPAALDNVYNDQMQAAVMLSSTPYNVKKITFGSNTGIPDFQHDKLNRILSCSQVYVDGVQHCKSHGAAWEVLNSENHPLRICKIDLVESLNPFTTAYDYWLPTGSGTGIGYMAVSDSTGTISVTNPFIIS